MEANHLRAGDAFSEREQLDSHDLNAEDFSANLDPKNYLDLKKFAREPDAKISDLLQNPITLIDRYSSYRPIYQEHDRGCVAATIVPLCKYLGAPTPLLYDAVRQDLLQPRYYDREGSGWSNDGELIHRKTLEHYFNSELSLSERGPFRLQSNQAHSLDDLIDTIERTKRPVIVAYLLHMVPEKVVQAWDLVFSVPILGGALAKVLTGGDRYALPAYLHVGAVLGVCEDDNGERWALMTDPWKGKAIGCSRPSALIEPIRESVLASSWLKYENGSIALPWVKDWWQREYKRRMLELYPPGGYFSVECAKF